MFCHSTSEHILRLHQTLLLLVATVVPGVAQVTVDQSLSMEEYVGLLLGEGVTAFNIDTTGSEVQFGFFQGGASVGFAMDEGVILSSAHASSAFPNVSGECSDFLDVEPPNFGNGEPHECRHARNLSIGQ